MSLATALKRSWLLILVAVLLCTGAAVAVGLVRDPEYKAESQLFVGSLDVRTLSIPGFVLASQQLAEAYSRIAESDAVVVPVARRLGLSPSEVRDRVSSANIPQTQVVRIQVTGPSEAEVLDLLRAETATTRAYISRLTVGNPQAEALLRRFRAAAARAQQLEARAGRLKARQDAGEDVTNRQVDRARTEAETARLRANALAQAYGEASARSSDSASVQVLNPALEATDDRREVLERLIFLGLAAGLVLGAALALFRQRRALQRA